MSRHFDKVEVAKPFGGGIVRGIENNAGEKVENPKHDSKDHGGGENKPKSLRMQMQIPKT